LAPSQQEEILEEEVATMVEAEVGLVITKDEAEEAETIT
jgi:hypothetical protein